MAKFKRNWMLNVSVSPAFTEMYLFYLAKCSSIVSHTKFEVFGWREVDKPFVLRCEFCFNKKVCPDKGYFYFNRNILFVDKTFMRVQYDFWSC